MDPLQQSTSIHQTDFDSGDYKSIEYYCEYHPDTMRGKIQIN